MQTLCETGERLYRELCDAVVAEYDDFEKRAARAAYQAHLAGCEQCQMATGLEAAK